MNYRLKALLAPAGLLAALALAGCTTSGLSPREGRGHDFTTYTFASSEAALLPPQADQPGSTAAPEPISQPARIAVAQIGEVAPPTAMLDQLRAAHKSFAVVEGIPGVESPTYASDSGIRTFPQAYRQAPRPAPNSFAQEDNRLKARQQLDRMRGLARQVGAKYLFLYGGMIDRSETSTPLSMANLTIVGIFIVPSEKIEARATAAGSLIDVNTGRVVLVATADGHKETLSPSAAVDGDEIELLSALRDDVTNKLAHQLIQQVQSQSSDSARPMGG